MESPPLESPMDDEVYPCKGCGDILEEGKAFELAGNRWHLNCFRCNTCDTLLDSDANLLLLGDGSLICNNCTYSCSACGNKIEDLAILTGDQAFCATCFRCRNCKRKIENLRYARTSQGIFCMSCHESLMARRRKKSRANAAAKSKEKDSALVDKSLPALPSNAIPLNTFSPDRDTAESTETDTPTELSPRPRTTTYPNGSSSRRDTSPDRIAGEQSTRDGLTLPSTTYRSNRHSAISQASDMNGGDGESFFIPLALDPSPAPIATPRSAADPTKKENKGPERDYFTAPKSSLRSQAAETKGKSEANSQMSTPHIAFQERGREPSSEYVEKPQEVLRKAQPGGSNRTPSATASPAISGDDTKVQIANSPDILAMAGAGQSSGDRFRLQEVPKSKKSSILRSNSQSDAPSPVSDNSTSRFIPRKEPANLSKSDSSTGLLATEKSGTPRTSQDSRPSMDSNASSVPPPRSETQGKAIVRKEVLTSNNKNSNSFSSGQDTSSSSASSTDTPGVTPTVNGKTISGPLMQSPVLADLIPPSRAPARPAPPQQKLSDSYMTPRAPPAPPQAQSHKSGKASVGSLGEPISPKLPRWSSGGDFTMDEDMARILGGTDETSQSLLRRVSNAVRHGRTGSEASISARHGHGRSVSETTRTTASPRWPKTPIAEDGNVARDISSPLSISSPILDDPSILRRQLRNSEQRIQELERQYAGSTELKHINKKLQERRNTCNMLDSQAELMVRQLEVLTDLAEKGKSSKDPMKFEEMQGMAFEQFTDKFKKLMEQMQGSLEKIVGEIDVLTVEKNALVEEKITLTRDRDLLVREFESLSSKNAQLADLNNDLTHQIQERFKAQSANYLESPRPSTNGLGIYTNHNKSKSNMSIHAEDISGRPSTGNTTLMGSTAASVGTYPQAMEQDQGMEPTVLAAPHVINIRKGRANKFNWKKGSATVAKGVSKGFKGAFSSVGQERNQWAGQPGDNIGMPYDTTVAPMESPGPNSMPRSASNDPARQGGGGFGLFKKSATVPKTSSNGAIVNVAAEPPSKLFGSLLVERADFERSQIPSIVTRCIEEVQLRGMDVEGIYRRSGGAGQVKAIQDGFEKSTDYDDISDPEIDIIAVTSALKQYFRKLPIPLLTFEVYDRVLDSRFVEDVEERCDHLRETFSQLHPKHRDCLEFLIFHLAQVAERSAENKMGPKNIATVFAPTIMRNRILEREFQDVGPRNDVVEFVIEHCYDIFNNE